MATVWSDEDEPQEPPKLVKLGARYSKRILHKTKSSLFGRQQEALESLVRWFGSEDTRDYTAVVVMPTGSGKTGVICCLPYVIGGAINDKTVSSETINLNKPILIIAPGLDILKQLEENLKGDPFIKNRGFLRPNEMRDYYTIETVNKTSEVAKLQSQMSYDIILTNSQKWRRSRNSENPNYGELPSDLFSMVIVDEAHHLPAKQWQNIVQKFHGHAKVVFFTATPYRMDGKEITADGAISTRGYAYKLTREEAIADKLIRDVKFKELPYPEEVHQLISMIPDPDDPTTNQSLKLTTGIPDDTDPPSPKRAKLLERIQFLVSRDEPYYEEVLREVKKCVEEKNKTPLPGNTKHTAIIITKMIDEADKVRDICTEELGFDEDKVAVVHTEKIKSDRARETTLAKIKSGQYDIVIIVQMLLEGFDYPPFSIAGILTNIVSNVKFAQFIGRIQRVVRVPNKDGKMEVEGDVVGDIITHEYFEQKPMYEYYLNPRIPDELEDTTTTNSSSKPKAQNEV